MLSALLRRLAPAPAATVQSSALAPEPAPVFRSCRGAVPIGAERQEERVAMFAQLRRISAWLKEISAEGERIEWSVPSRKYPSRKYKYKQRQQKYREARAHVEAAVRDPTAAEGIAPDVMLEALRPFGTAYLDIRRFTCATDDFLLYGERLLAPHRRRKTTKKAA